MGLSYGLYVPDWNFKISTTTSSLPPNGSYGYMVRKYYVPFPPSKYFAIMLFSLVASF